MFGHRYFGAVYFGPRYFGPAGSGGGGPGPAPFAQVKALGQFVLTNLVSSGRVSKATG